MSSHWRPQPDGRRSPRRDPQDPYYPRSGHYGRDYHSTQGHDRYDDHYRPPQSSRADSGYGSQSQPSWQGSQPDRPHRPDQFSFRGAAHNGYQSHAQHHEFSFRSSGPPAPSFPRHRSPLRGEPPRKRTAYDSAASNKRGRGSRYNKHAFPRKSRAAHEREVLSINREPTPEQLEGMNGSSHPRFIDFDEVDDTENSILREQRRLEIQASNKWSNPDPYTALPPVMPEAGPKRDLVSVIRKAKLEAAKAAAKVTVVDENADFLSFQVDHDTDELSSDSDSSLASNVAIEISNIGSNCLKRKYVDEAIVATVCESWRARAGEDATPWFRPDRDRRNITDPGQRLHEEICDFHEYVKPRPEDEAARIDIIDRVRTMLNRFFPRDQGPIELHAFGSFASGLYLPSADMDLVALSRSFLKGHDATLCQAKSQIWRLVSHIKRSNMALEDDVLAIVHARVPLVKWTDRVTGVKIDLSFENPSGLLAIKYFELWERRYPAMPALVLLIKQILAMREQNEVHTGGFGGFTVICLVVSMMQMLPEMQIDPETPHRYGHLLLHLLKLYGEEFDLDRVEISMRPPGYRPKTGSRDRIKLSIIDPNNPLNDISGGSRNVEEIFGMFRDIRHAIHTRLLSIERNRDDSDSILGCVIGGHYSRWKVQQETLDSVAGDLWSLGIRPKRHALPDLSAAPQVVDRKIARAVDHRPRGGRGGRGGLARNR